jgi:FkbM family methyltransferase
MLVKTLKNWLNHFPYIKQVLKSIKRNLLKIASIFRPELTPITSGTFDLDELVTLLGNDDPVILEIGANDGSHTALFLERFPRAKIYAFEPDPRACEKFQQRLGTDPRVVLEKIAISAIDGEIDFFMSDSRPSEHIPAHWDMSSSIRKPKKHLEVFPWCTFEQTIKVPTHRLDTWLQRAGIQHIDFIWADVQGAEIDLIQGGKTALAHTRYFYTEYANEELYEGQVCLRDMLRLLPNFQLIYRFSGDVLLKNKCLK